MCFESLENDVIHSSKTNDLGLCNKYRRLMLGSMVLIHSGICSRTYLLIHVAEQVACIELLAACQLYAMFLHSFVVVFEILCVSLSTPVSKEHRQECTTLIRLQVCQVRDYEKSSLILLPTPALLAAYQRRSLRAPNFKLHWKAQRNRYVRRH
jgi:hypothetical protein